LRGSLAALVYGAVVAMYGISAARPAAAETLTRLEADSLGGTHVVLPTDALGQPLVLLIAFGKRPQTDVQAWSRKLLADHLADRAHVYVVVVVDNGAIVGRRHIFKIVREAAVGTEEQMQSSVLVTFDGKPWKAVVPGGDPRAAGVVVCDAKGEVVYAKRALFGSGNVSDVEAAARRE
jgi:hypothetical protein